MIWLSMYIVLGFVMFFVMALYFAKDRVKKSNGRELELDVSMALGILLAVVAALWPITVFGVLNLYVVQHINKKHEREAELTRELSRG